MGSFSQARRNWPRRRAVLPLTALSLFPALTLSASAGCYWQRTGEFCVPDTESGPTQTPAVHRQRPAGDGVAGTFRTLCVRSCDGYYFPISYATDRSHFKTDAAVCQSIYPPGEALLYVHRTTGQTAEQAVSALTGKPLAGESFAFAYRSTYDQSCAGLFRSGSGARITIRKPPVPESVVAASLMTPAPPAADGKLPKSLAVLAADEMPANLDSDAKAAEPSADSIRTVGPAYYYEPSYGASTGGEPSRLAQPDVPVVPVVSTEASPVTASILLNPFDFFHKPKSAALPEPAAEPDQEN
jgi:hypothetical protein